MLHSNRPVRSGEQHIKLARDLTEAVKKAKMQNERQEILEEKIMTKALEKTEKRDERREAIEEKGRIRKASFIGFRLDMCHYLKLDVAVRTIDEKMEEMPDGKELFQSALEHAEDDRARYAIEMLSKYENSRAPRLRDWLDGKVKKAADALDGMTGLCGATLGLLTLTVGYVMEVGNVRGSLGLGFIGALPAAALPTGIELVLDYAHNVLKGMKAVWDRIGWRYMEFAPPSPEKEISMLSWKR